MDPRPKTKGPRLYPQQRNLELVGAARLPKVRGPTTLRFGFVSLTPHVVSS